MAEQQYVQITEISIHALLAESDAICPQLDRQSCEFLSTLSLRRATGLPARRQISEVISIHALLAESDLHNAGPLPTVCRDFYPRSPCGERHVARAANGVF